MMIRARLDAFGMAGVAVVLGVAGCRPATGIATPSTPSDPPLGILVSPSSPSLYTGGAQQFAALGQYATGGSGSVSVTWAATGGSISVNGLFIADTIPGQYVVTATQQGGALVGVAVATVLPPPQRGNYVTVAQQDWSSYPDKASLVTLFGVEGGLNMQAPALPPSAFYDLVTESVPDGAGGMISGKAVRYLGDPALNTTDPKVPGRIAVHKAKFADLDDVWVRQYVKFSTNWTTHGTNPIGAADAYKFMFFRFDGADFRLGHILQGARNEIMELGQGPNGSWPGAITVQLPWDHHVAVSATDGAYGMDAHAMIKGGNYQGPPVSLGGDGDGEWYEVVLRFKKVDTMVMQGAVAKRRVTLGGAWNPGSWSIIARQVTHTGDPTVEYIRPVFSYEMGVNRNKQWDDVMWIDWGRYEVVNGALYANPFNVPNVP